VDFKRRESVITAQLEEERCRTWIWGEWFFI